MPIRSKRVQEWFYLFIQMLFLCEDVQVLYTFLEFFLHDESSTLCEYLEFFNYFQIDFKWSCSLQSVTGTIKVSHLYFQFGNLIQCFRSCFFRAIEFDCLLIRQDCFIEVFCFCESHAFKKIGLWVFWALCNDSIQILQCFFDIPILNVSDPSFQ